MKNIVVVMGSPRKKGNTDILADAFITGAIQAGNQVEKIDISSKHINGCIGCNFCYKEGNQCVYKDDMPECYHILAKADIIVIATPIYFYGVSSQIKCMIDRLHNPIRNTFKVKKLVLLAVCADTIPTVFDSVKVMYHSVLRYFNLENAGIITVYGLDEKGNIIGNPALEEAEMLGKQID